MRDNVRTALPEYRLRETNVRTALPEYHLRETNVRTALPEYHPIERSLTYLYSTCSTNRTVGIHLFCILIVGLLTVAQRAQLQDVFLNECARELTREMRTGKDTGRLRLSGGMLEST